MFTCKEHILNGIRNLKTPHVCKTDKRVRCFFCKNQSEYEFYYLDYNFLGKKVYNKSGKFIR
ncbi:hypothetical protein DX930_27890 [Bacillus cereus]|nr:hypothetical protein DX930_27890 [Bacillus cereus]